MRKLLCRLVALAILVLMGTNIKAQDDKAITLGVKGGLNLSNFFDDATDDHNSKLGFNVGATVDYRLVKQWRLYSGLEYSLLGAKNDLGSLSLGYLQVPVYGGYKYDCGSYKLVLKLGSYVGYALHGTYKVEIEGVNSSTNAFNSDLDLYRRFDFGLGSAFGIEFGQFEFFTSYMGGLFNIRKNSSDNSLRNYNISLSIGYRFK